MELKKAAIGQSQSNYFSFTFSATKFSDKLLIYECFLAFSAAAAAATEKENVRRGTPQRSPATSSATKVPQSAGKVKSAFLTFSVHFEGDSRQMSECKPNFQKHFFGFCHLTFLILGGWFGVTDGATEDGHG